MNSQFIPRSCGISGIVLWVRGMWKIYNTLIQRKLYKRNYSIQVRTGINPRIYGNGLSKRSNVFEYAGRYNPPLHHRSIHFQSTKTFLDHYFPNWSSKGSYRTICYTVGCIFYFSWIILNIRCIPLVQLQKSCESRYRVSNSSIQSSDIKEFRAEFPNIPPQHMTVCRNWFKSQWLNSTIQGLYPENQVLVNR